ncbi:retrovirus-related pol polyprotein from transposon TNT 1-94 [Tanacetum coccineum]
MKMSRLITKSQLQELHNRIVSLKEAVTTACYTQNQSLIHSRNNKTPYELMHDCKLDLKYLHVFGALCYPTNDSEDLGKLKPKADIADTTGTPSSIIIDQDAPSVSTSPTTVDTQAPVIHQEPSSEESSSRDVILSNLHQINQLFDYLKKWTKDHSLDNVVGNPSRLVSTRRQLQTDVRWSYFDAFLTKLEPKNYKEAMKEYCWIDAIQEEIHEFDRLQVWELVPFPDHIMLTNLKWLFKVKLDEFGGVLKNKAWLVVKGYRQEERIDFEESFAQSIFSLCYLFRKSFSLTSVGDENPIRTLGDYSRPSHEGYRNTIELLGGNNVVPLRSDTIRFVQNGCSFHRLRSEDPNQHLKDFLKLVESLNLDVANREMTRLRLFQYSFRDQVSNWLECLSTGSISTWEDLTTHFLA